MLEGISITDYRSIGQTQCIAPLGKINLFVGPNNSGKSNILRFINENLGHLTNRLINGSNQTGLISHAHNHRGKPTTASMCILVTLKTLQDRLKVPSSISQGSVYAIHTHLAPDDRLWIDEQWPDRDFINKAKEWIPSHQWRSVWEQATSHGGGDLEVHWIPDTLRLIKQLVPPAPDVYAIPINRQAGHEVETAEKGNTAKILGGKGVIRELAALQNPQSVNFVENRERFAAIEAFVRVVTDDSTASLSVTHKQDEILVQLKGQPYLPLESLGSGIEQVVLHAVAATLATDAIVTFEEPELHLHPVLQRQLMVYLAETSNQYFISTHSAHLIDALHANTFHVRLVEGQTLVEQASTDAARHRVCTDLGYRPSDIVQANCVIWVEGPSDRIYIRHWLEQVDPHLREHVHFSIMFYGGKLLSHLSAGETDTVEDGLKDLIQLRLLNRQVAVIIDSDLKAADQEIRPTKRRVQEEIYENGGLVWVTAGREIENYIPRETMVAAVEKVSAARGKAVKSGQYDKALPSAKPNSKNTVDKVKTAEAVAEAGCALTMLDLRQRIRTLSDFIRNANGLPPRTGANSDSAEFTS